MCSLSNRLPSSLERDYVLDSRETLITSQNIKLPSNSTTARNQRRQGRTALLLALVPLATAAHGPCCSDYRVWVTLDLGSGRQYCGGCSWENATGFSFLHHNCHCCSESVGSWDPEGCHPQARQRGQTRLTAITAEPQASPSPFPN